MSREGAAVVQPSVKEISASSARMIFVWMDVVFGLTHASTPAPRPAAAAGRHRGLRMATTLEPKQASSRRWFQEAETNLERLTGNQQALLEAVVGLPGGKATYDRDAIVEYFKRRPTVMAGRALDFLQAFRRVKSAWDANGADGQDRGVVLRNELSKLGPVSVKIGQTMSCVDRDLESRLRAGRRPEQ